jgi:tRNA-specific 2-thiouridylase
MPTFPIKKKRVVVAMSGGVDSSVAAALLQEQGYEVIGLTMRLWDQPVGDGAPPGGCCSPGDIRDARRVADQLDIPHYVINLKKAFEEEVIGGFIEEYLGGRTPNPCIHCNDRIKFGFLLRKAEELGAAALATGHYARIVWAPDVGPGRESRYLLLRGKDLSKDQSYFLFTLSQKQMAKVMFPLGEISKTEVRRQASKIGLRVAEKAESQEICFIPENDYRRFLEERKGKEILEPGEIVDRGGKVLGFHRGLHSFTIGQRHGLGLAAPHPYYVLNLDRERNRVVVGAEHELLAGGLVARGVNWISFSNPEETHEALVQIRYRHAGVPSSLTATGEGKIEARFATPQKSVTPGQAAVFYRGEEVLGGGWIERAL